MMVPFVGGSYRHPSSTVSSQYTLNLIPERVMNGSATSQFILRGISGSKTYVDLSSYATTGCRGLHYTSTSRAFAVYGRKVVEVDASGSVVHSYNISLGSGNVSMADNGSYLAIADGYTLWYVNLTANTIVSVDSGVTNPFQIVYLAHRFVLIGKDSNQYTWSEVGASGVLNWLGGYASAEGSADVITCLSVTQGELFLGGSRSYEVHTITSDNEAPFRRAGGSFSNIGVQSPWSVAEVDNTIYFLGSSNSGSNRVYKLHNYSAEAVSDIAIYDELSNASNTSDAIGFTWQEKGQAFYGLTLVQGDKTLVYSATNGLWHHRSTRDAITNVDHKWEVQHIIWAWGKLLTGGATVPQLLELDQDAHTEYDGRVIRRLHRSPQYREDLAPIFFLSFELDIQGGVGTGVGQGLDPKVMMRVSDDGGETYGNILTAPMGKMGRWKTKPKWHNLGVGEQIVVEVSVTDPVDVTILGAKMLSRRSSRV